MSETTNSENKIPDTLPASLPLGNILEVGDGRQRGTVEFRAYLVITAAELRRMAREVRKKDPKAPVIIRNIKLHAFSGGEGVQISSRDITNPANLT